MNITNKIISGINYTSYLGMEQLFTILTTRMITGELNFAIVQGILDGTTKILCNLCEKNNHLWGKRNIIEAY